jgi:hypothetical protein
MICLLISIPVFSKSIVLDEAYSIVFARGTVWEIIKSTAADVHPPLYYFMLRIVKLLFGESIVKYRIVTAFATYLNLIWLGATLIRKRWGESTAYFYILWFGLTYCTFEKTMIIRMYPLGAFLVTGAVIYLFSLYENWKKKDYIMSILFTIAAMYTHYYAVMAVFAAWLILLVVVCMKKRDKVKPVLGCGIVIAAGYIPWIGILLSQTRKVINGYWIPSFEWSNWFKAPALLMDSSLNGSGNVLYFLVFVIILTAFIRKKWDAIVCALIFAGTMLIAALLSVFVAPIWEERYLYVAWGVLSMAMAIVLGDRFSEYSAIVQWAATCFLCIAGFFSFTTMYQSELNNDTAALWVKFLEENVKKEDLIIADDNLEHILVYQAYLPDNEVVMASQVVGMDYEEAQKLFSDAADSNIWFVINYVMQTEGVDAISEVCERYDLNLSTMGRYTIQAKDLEIFSVQGE